METITTQTMNCSHCGQEMDATATFCDHCGYPENGTDQQKSRFIGKMAFNKSWNEDAKKKIKSAKNTLYVLSGVMAVFGFIQYTVHESIYALGIDFALSLVYLALAFWTDTKPLIAVLIGLLLYLTIIVINAIVDPTSLFQGIIWKVVIISFLGKGIYSASSIKKDALPS